MIRHIVLIKSPKPDQIDKLFKRTSAMKMEGLIKVEYSDNLSERGQGYNRIFILDFKDKNALETFTSHPLYESIHNVLKAAESELIVFDYESKNSTGRG